MRVLLDECLPRRLKTAITEHEVVTVAEAGWAGRSNGDLLALAELRFDAFVTVDRGMPAQQRVGARSLAIVILIARTNRYDDLLPLVPGLQIALSVARPGEVVRVGLDTAT